MAQPRTRLVEARNGVPRPLIAVRLGITPQALGMIERGERAPRLPLMQRIADYYGHSMDYFFGSEGHGMDPGAGTSKTSSDKLSQLEQVVRR